MSQTSAGAVFSRPGRAELSRLERPCRAPQRSRAGSSGHFERTGGVERARAAISSAPAEPSGLERLFRAPWWRRAGSSGHFERPGGAERARAAVSSAPAEPSGFEVANVGRCGVFEQGQCRESSESASESASESGRSSSRFERPSGAERARAAISSAPAEPSGLDVANVGRCGVFAPGRAELSS